MPGDLADHRFTRPEGLVQCESMLVIVWPPSTYAMWPSKLMLMVWATCDMHFKQTCIKILQNFLLNLM